MAHLSKKSLSPNIEKLVEDYLAGILSYTKTKAHGQQLIEELLGPEERLMIAKRLGVLVLLSHEVSPYRIAETLGISQTTVDNLTKRFRNGPSGQLLTLIEKYEKTKIFWETIGKLSRAGLPPYKHRLSRDILR